MKDEWFPGIWNQFVQESLVFAFLPAQYFITFLQGKNPYPQKIKGGFMKDFHLPFGLFLICCSLFFLPQVYAQENTTGEMVLQIQAGSQWSAHLPQGVVWMEGKGGKPVITLWITPFEARMAANLSDPSQMHRPESLPVWQYRYLPEKEKTGFRETDAVSGATPQGDVHARVSLPGKIPQGVYSVFAEFNQSFDYNEKYAHNLPESHPAHNLTSGQPSLLFAGKILVGEKEQEVMLEPAGAGSPDGKDGKIYKNPEGITTAKEIVDSVIVEYHPKP